MRKWFLNIHLYGGLLCSSYLLIYGLSSLHFNHHTGGRPDGPVTKIWTGTVSMPDSADDMRLASHVRDELGLFGWPLSWTMSRDENENLRFEMERPGRKYKIQVAQATGEVTVEEIRRGLWWTLRSLHGFRGNVPGGSWFLSLWSVFTELTNWIVLFSAASGVYLWLSSRRDLMLGWGFLFAATAFSLTFMLVVWLRG